MAKMSLKNKFALIGIPMLLVALGAAVYISQTETSTETKAAGGSCEKRCEEDWKGKPNNLKRCLDTCDQPGANWRLDKDIAQGFCNQYALADSTLTPEEKASKNYLLTLRDKIIATLKAAIAQGQAADKNDYVRLKKKLDNFTAGDMTKAHEKYCTTSDDGE